MRLVIADGSAVVRSILEQNMSKYTDVEITSLVSNGKKLLQTVEEVQTDVVLSGLDINDEAEKEAMNAVIFEKHIPILLLSDIQDRPVRIGEMETIEKPKISAYTKEFFDSLVTRLRQVASSLSTGCRTFSILCIGASTGGPSATSEVLQGLGKDFPIPILYAQHIDTGADKNMADWFSSVCHDIQIKLAENGEEAKAGFVYMAPADKHLVIDYVRPNGNPVLRLSDDEPERFLRPAVNKLFRSAARYYRNHCLALLLTGMGADGAEGCKEICDNGGWTIAEDRSTCAVFGMPAAAIALGGAKEVLPRPEISKRILELVGK